MREPQWLCVFLRNHLGENVEKEEKLSEFIYVEGLLFTYIFRLQVKMHVYRQKIFSMFLALDISHLHKLDFKMYLRVILLIILGNYKKD